MLSSVTGAVAGWSIFSLVTMDVVIKNRFNKNINVKKGKWEIPQFNWYRLGGEIYEFETYDDKKAKK